MTGKALQCALQLRRGMHGAISGAHRLPFFWCEDADTLHLQDKHGTTMKRLHCKYSSDQLNGVRT